MTVFDLTFYNELYIIYPATLVKTLFNSTNDNVLYIKGISMNPMDENEYLYRCVMNWSEDDCNLTIAELSDMLPEAEPEGLFTEEVLCRGERLRSLIDMGAPKMVVCNEANLLLIATVLNRFAVDVEKIVM